MKFLLFASMAAVAAANVDIDDGSLALEDRFEAYIEKFSKTYSDDEKDKRFSAFKINDAIIQESNSQGLPYTLGHNPLSDLTNDEFKATYINGYKESLRPKKFDFTLSDKTRVAAAPDSIDWVAKGAVTPVKNQGQCGSCWAFSTIMGVEGDLFVETGSLTSLSEQDLVSCDHNGDQGCNGGLMDNAFEFIVTNGGIATEESYPYVSGSGSVPACKSTAAKAVTIKDHTDVPAKNEDALKVAAAQQPVSVAIEADKSVFQLYKSGVLTGDCGTNLDHGVGVVGYGTESGTDYWKVKNSWGADWGLQGYVLIERGTNKCGISQSASYPTGAHTTGSAPSPSVAPSPSTPSPSTPPAGKTHYGDPKNGCLSDEKSIQITGVAGDACSPACTGVFKTKCPTDLPTGTTAEAKCALQDTSGDKYCILECTTDEHCPENASCKAVSGAPVSLCTYDDR